MSTPVTTLSLLAEDQDDAMWVVHEVERPFEDVLDDPRLNKNKKLLKPIRTRTLQANSSSARDSSVGELIEMIKLYEIRDRKWNRVIVISADHDHVLYKGPDDLQTTWGFNFFPLQFNNDDEVFWAVPDAAIVEPQQLEMNEIRTQMMRHRRVCLIKIMAEENAIDPHEAAKMVSEDVAAVVTVKDINRVKPLQIADIPGALAGMSEIVQSDVREQIGFSRNQMAE